MLIYIRHGNDDDSDATYKHDPHLQKKGKSSVKKVAKDLIRKYGMPNIIYVSPMRRTLDTLESMKPKLSKDVSISIDPKVSRYFTRKEQMAPSVAPKSRERNTPIYEDHNIFKKRVDKHISYMKSKNYHKEKVVWVITHTLVIKRVAKKFNVFAPGYFNFLETVIIDK